MDPFGPLQATALEGAHVCTLTYDDAAPIDLAKQFWTLFTGFHN